MTISGVFTALITPFKGDAVDYDGMRNNIRFQIEQGINGILPLGTTGETPTITREEKKNIIRTHCAYSRTFFHLSYIFIKVSITRSSVISC